MAVFPSLYAPPVLYFAYLYREQGHKVVFEAKEHFVKQSLRNRCQILTANGVQTLSIPLEGANKTKTAMEDVRISAHDSWQKKHIQAIVSAYSNSPFFEYYWDDILPHYQEAVGQTLWSFNSNLTAKLTSLIDLELDYQANEEYVPSDDRVLDLRYQLDKGSNEDLLKVLSKNPYYQVFAERYGFTANLSIFDLIFNMGSESLLYLKYISDYLSTLLA